MFPYYVIKLILWEFDKYRIFNKKIIKLLLQKVAS